MAYDRVSDRATTAQAEPSGLAAQYADMTAPPPRGNARAGDPRTPDTPTSSANAGEAKSGDAQTTATRSRSMSVDEQADIPYRYIEAADAKNHGRAPEHSQRFLAAQKAERGVPIEQQADVYRWINAAAKFEQTRPREIVAKAGDTYWSVAQGLVSLRNGRQATDVEVHGMVKKLAQFNGKSEAEANVLKVGQVIKVPGDK